MTPALVAFALLAAAFGDTNNPYLELDSDVRAMVAAKLVPRADLLARPDAETERFVGWYQRTRCRAGTNCQPDLAAYAEFSYNHQSDRTERIAIACVLSAIRAEFPGFPAEPPGLGRLSWAGTHGEVNFEPAGDDAQLQTTLRGRGYSGANGACIRSNCLWGVRSKTVGRALHWKRASCDGQPCNAINVHLDLWNPGVTAIPHDHSVDVGGAVHYLHDDWRRKDTHETPELLVGDRRACGVGLHDLMAVIENTRGSMRGRLRALLPGQRCGQ